MASLKEAIALHLKNERTQPKPVGIIDAVSRTLKGAKSIAEKYFEPDPSGQVRLRDVFKRGVEAYDKFNKFSVPGIQSTLPTPGNIKKVATVGKLGLEMAQDTARNISSPILSTINKVREMDGKKSIDTIKPEDQESVFTRDLQRIIFGDDAIESVGQRIKKAPERTTELAKSVGFKKQNIVTPTTAPFFVAGTIAMDLFPGAGKADDAADILLRTLERTDDVGEAYQLLRKANVPNNVAVEYAQKFAKTKNPIVIKKEVENLDNILSGANIASEPVKKARKIAEKTPGLDFSKLTDESRDAIMNGLYDLQKTGFQIKQPGSSINFDSFGEMEDLLKASEKRPLKGEELRQAAELLMRQGKQLPILETKKARLISDDAYKAAKTRFEENSKRVLSGVPVDQIKDFSIIAAYHIENGVRDIGEFTQKMIEEGYDLSKEAIQKLYDDAFGTYKKSSMLRRASDFDTADEYIAFVNNRKQVGTNASDLMPATDDEARDIWLEANKGIYNIANTVDEAKNIKNKEYGFIKTARNAELTNQEVSSRISGEYLPGANSEDLKSAQKLIDDSYDLGHRIATDRDAPLTAKTVAVSLDMVRRAQNNGNYELAIDIIENISRKAKSQGQAIQALSMWGRMTPEGMLKTAQRVVNKYNIANPGKKPLSLDPDTAKKIIDNAKEINGMEDGYEKVKKTARAIQDINELVPPTFWRKISMYQTIAQLLNFKTIKRNIIGNVGFAAIENTKDIFAAALDSALTGIRRVAGDKNAQRTKTLPDFYAQFKGAKEGFLKGIDEALLGINTANSNTQFDLPQTKTFRGGIGGKLETLMNVSLKAPDRMLYQAAHDGSLASQMKIANVTEPTEEMLELAHHDALYRTFQDDNAISQAFTGLKKALNLGQEFGLGDIVLKYPKTPANILSRGLAYSPAGFIKTIFETGRNLFNGKPFDQRQFVESFSRATTGSVGLIGLGALLHRNGLITGKRPKDKDIEAVQKETGLGQYRINASGLKRFLASGFDPEAAKLQPGDTLVSYDWFQPAAIGIAMGANIDEAAQTREITGKTYKGFVETLLDGVANGVDTIFEQPLLQGLARTFKYGDASDAMTGLVKQIPASFIPVLLNESSQFVDNTSRNVYDPSWIDEGWNAAKRKIPGLAQTLTPNVGVFGEERETYQDGTNNLFNVFFNPMFISKYTPTPESELVLDLFNETGSTDQAPRVVSKTVNVNGKNIKIGPKRMYEMQRFIGQTSKIVFSELAQNPAFNELSSEDKVKYLSNVLSNIGSAAKIAVLKIPPSKNPSKMTIDILNWYSVDERIKRGAPDNAKSPMQGFEELMQNNFDLQPE